MNPYLEHPSPWTDVHNRLITAIRDAVVPLVAPDYYVGLEWRTYLLILHDLYRRVRFDLRLVYSRSPASPLIGADGEWAAELLRDSNG